MRTGATASMIDGIPGTRYVSPQPERPSASVILTTTYACVLEKAMDGPVRGFKVWLTTKLSTR